MRYKLIKKHELMPSSLRVGDMISKLNGQWIRVDALFDRDGIERSFITTAINVTDAELLNPEYWELERQVLYTSYDGVDVYEGDRYYLLNTNTGSITLLHATKKDCTLAHFVIFSSKSSANDFIWQNKKELSYNDIKYWIDNKLDLPFLERYVKNQLNK